MNIFELYASIEGDYNQVIERFSGNEAIIRKFIKRFPDDNSFGELMRAFESCDENLIYKSALTMLEVCNSLSFSKMSQTLSLILSAYQSGEASYRGLINVPSQMDKLQRQYEKTIEKISQFE